MADLSKLDETINQLEQHVEKFKHNSDVLAKLSELSLVIGDSVSELKTGNSNFIKIQSEIQESLNKVKQIVIEIDVKNEKHIETIVSSNRKFLRELEEDTRSKLEKFSSDIQVSGRQERAHLQETLQNSLTTQFNNLESKQTNLFSIQSKQLNVLKFLTAIVILLSLACLIKSLL